MQTFEDYLRAEFMKAHQVQCLLHGSDKDKIEIAFEHWLDTFQIDDWFKYEKNYRESQPQLEKIGSIRLKKFLFDTLDTLEDEWIFRGDHTEKELLATKISELVDSRFGTPKMGVELEKILPKEIEMDFYGESTLPYNQTCIDVGFNNCLKQIKENYERIYGGKK